MRVARVGLAVLKGTRHQERSTVELSAQGPVGDRRFCLVDAGRGQVLKTVEHGALLAATADWQDGVLSVDLAGRVLAGVPEPTGSVLEVDYWGRPVTAAVVGGPWAAAFSAVLGRPVELAQVVPGAIVYGGQVSVITTASLAALRAERRTGADGPEPLDPVRDAARFRATVLVDTEDSPYAEPGSERSWIGRELDLGPARIRLTSSIVRCAVVDLEPVSGRPDLRLLRALPRDDTSRPIFGLEGEVVSSGLVSRGDRVATIGP